VNGVRRRRELTAREEVLREDRRLASPSPSWRAARGRPVPVLSMTGGPVSDTNSRRVLTILRYLSGHRPALTSAIVRDCHIPRSSAYRLLRVMEEEQFVIFDAAYRRWGLGSSSYELGSSFLLSDSLIRQTTRVLVELAAQTTARISVGVLDGNNVMMLASHCPDGPARADDGQGCRYPAHLTATGKALLAHRARGDLIALFGKGPLARPTGRGPRTVDELVGELREVEERGYAESAEDLADGIWAFAAPVHSTADRVVAALAAVFCGRPPVGDAMRQATAALTNAAAEVSARLGYRPDDPAAATPAWM
jgi:DNA-binding IclR family transcriptional regulator